MLLAGYTSGRLCAYSTEGERLFSEVVHDAPLIMLRGCGLDAEIELLRGHVLDERDESFETCDGRGGEKGVHGELMASLHD